MAAHDLGGPHGIGWTAARAGEQRGHVGEVGGADGGGGEDRERARRFRAAVDEAVEVGEAYGIRNSQATVLAPTGCLVGGTLVPTERGLVRLGSLGDPVGDQWQPLGIDVQTDEGERTATQFYVNGVEPVVDVVTARGYRLRGTTRHRVKVVDDSGEWVWRHLADLRAGDRVPLSLNQLVGWPQEVTLPPLDEAHWTRDRTTRVPRVLTPELAEFVGAPVMTTLTGSPDLTAVRNSAMSIAKPPSPT